LQTAYQLTVFSVSGNISSPNFLEHTVCRGPIVKRNRVMCLLPFSPEEATPSHLMAREHLV